MKLIPLDAVLAEIERRIKRFREEKDSVSIVKTNTYKGILSFLDSLEVKEVDLEEEIERVRKTHFINDDFEKAALEGRQITNIAKHFFELGISVSNKAQKGE